MPEKDLIVNTAALVDSSNTAEELWQEVIKLYEGRITISTVQYIEMKTLFLLGIASAYEKLYGAFTVDENNCITGLDMDTVNVFVKPAPEYLSHSFKKKVELRELEEYGKYENATTH